MVPLLLDRAREADLRLLYWFAGPEESKLAESFGAVLVDRKVTFRIATRAGAVDPAIQPTTTATPKLHSLAHQSGHSSRFLADKSFPAGSFERMYSRWLDSSLAHAIAKEVLVYGDTEGFITLGVKGGRLDIGLLAVDAPARGRGIGSKLVSAAFARAGEWGLPEVQVVTQMENVGACRLYTSRGFETESVEYIYHLWL